MRFRDGDRTVSLGGKNTVDVVAGDRLTIHSPGGGGHGSPPGTADGGVDNKATSGDLEDPDRKSRREAEMRLSGSVSGHRLGQEQA